MEDWRAGMTDEAAAGQVLGYRDLFEASPDGIVVVDASGRIRDANPALEELFGYEREELLGREVEMLVPERVRGIHRGERSAFVADPHRRPMGIGMELRGRRRDDSEFPVEISLSPFRDDGDLFVIATVRDVSERQRLRDFGAGALRAAEEERRRIARELHDDAAQRLSNLLVRLRLARNEEDPERRDELLEALREELVDSAELVRGIARGLRPPALEDVGLAAAIRSHVRNQLGMAELDVDLDLWPSVDGLDPDGRLVVYRVVQEALSNTLRHAGAQSVRVSLRSEDGAVVAEVEDDGSGFDPERIVREGRGGLGLLGMEERASLVGGQLDVESVPSEGTRVRITVPLTNREADDG